MVSRPVVKAPDIAPLESLNWLIHHSFTHAQFIQCKELISGALRLSGMPLEYPLYCSGMIYMRESNASDALTQFQACAQLNPTSANYKKQCARCLLLLGRHDDALRYYADTAKITPNDWSLVCLRRAAYLNPLNWVITANRGVVALHIGQYASAVQMFRASIQLLRQSDEITKRKAKNSRGGYSEGMLQGLLALAYIGLDDHERARAANLLACKKDR
ncbi:hypothetical protein FGIG_10986 [Fasciola gigantica]|uniref:Bardet-Biedl syndrome 4 protein n=1 Tax=Fasciola gigantica TaxID=46835 RepID=A0A504Y7J2_FASGI|nr:hypothetical protein FGIG_10986 [Fasciola gigantica]